MTHSFQGSRFLRGNTFSDIFYEEASLKSKSIFLEKTYGEIVLLK